MIVVCRNLACYKPETGEWGLRYQRKWHYWSDYDEEYVNTMVLNWVPDGDPPRKIRQYVVSFWLVPGTISDEKFDNPDEVRGWKK